MKIAIPTADYPPIEGGISTLALHASRELAKLDHSVSIIAPHFEGMADFDAAETAQITRFHGYNRGWLRYAPMARAAAAPIAEADAVLAINVAYGGLMAKRAARPFAVMAYGYEFLKFQRNPILRSLLRSVYASSGRVIAISAFTRDALVQFGVDPARIDVILPGATPAIAADASEVAAVCAKFGIDSAPVILAVGRFIPRKGQETLIDALPVVCRQIPSARMVLVGRGPRLKAARARAVERGIESRVTFTGRISDAELAALYHLCDVFALPTGEENGGHVEGFGLVFSEAHAHGKPVVAGRSGGTADAVRDGETGILVDPDDPAAVADALIRVLQDPALAARLGEAGRRRIETELNWSAFTRRLAAVLESLQ